MVRLRRLEGKVALVTGGGSGIGAAACRKLAAEGAKVAVVDFRADAADQVAAEIGDDALPLVADVRDEAQIASAVGRCMAELGRLDFVFANAGINGMQCPIEEMTYAEWRDTIDTNLTGTFLTVKPSIPHLRESGGGSIAITASINGNRIWSLPGYSAYSSAKAAQSTFWRMAAVELGRWNIRVNTICPGGVRTNIGERTYRRNIDRVTYEGGGRPTRWPPLHGRSADPAEIADLVAFLASDESRYISGAEIVIDAAGSLFRA